MKDVSWLRRPQFTFTQCRLTIRHEDDQYHGDHVDDDDNGDEDEDGDYEIFTSQCAEYGEGGGGSGGCSHNGPPVKIIVRIIFW